MKNLLCSLVGLSSPLYVLALVLSLGGVDLAEEETPEATYGYSNESWKGDLRPVISIYKDFAKTALSKKDFALVGEILAGESYSTASAPDRDVLHNKWVDLENDHRYGRLKGDKPRVEHALLSALTKEAFEMEVTYKPGKIDPTLLSPTPFQSFLFKVMIQRDRERKQAILKTLRQPPKDAIVQMTYNLDCKAAKGSQLKILLNGNVLFESKLNEGSLMGQVPFADSLKTGKNHFQLKIYPPKAGKLRECSGQAQVMLASKGDFADTNGGNAGAFAEFLLDPSHMAFKDGAYYEVETTFGYKTGGPAPR